MRKNGNLRSKTRRLESVRDGPIGLGFIIGIYYLIYWESLANLGTIPRLVNTASMPNRISGWDKQSVAEPNEPWRQSGAQTRDLANPMEVVPCHIER